MPGAPESLGSLMDTPLQGPQPDAGPVGDGEPTVRRQRAGFAFEADHYRTIPGCAAVAAV